MSIETIPELKIDLANIYNESDLLDEMAPVQLSDSVLVYLNTSLDHIERLEKILCLLRAENASCILTLEAAKVTPPFDLIKRVMEVLRDWDQLLLINVLQLCQEWVPDNYLATLREQANIELKWYREWSLASHDPRIYKVPGLPWRRFIRKIIQENFDFGISFMKLVGQTPSLVQPDTDNLFEAFISRKKKAVSIFPKRWSNSH